MKTLKDIYIMVRQDCCFFTCPKTIGTTGFTTNCCKMHIIAEIMIIKGEY